MEEPKVTKQALPFLSTKPVHNGSAGTRGQTLFCFVAPVLPIFVYIKAVSSENASENTRSVD